VNRNVGLGFRKKIRDFRVWSSIIVSTVIFNLEDLDEVALFVRRLGKCSAREVLRKFGAQIENGSELECGLIIHNASGNFSNLVVKKDCHIGKDVFLDLKAPIIMHEGSTVAMRVTILTHMDMGKSGPFVHRFEKYSKAVEIGPKAYIGAGAIILPGVRVGEQTVVGAGALVNRDVTARTVVAGVPAKQIGEV
jgi:acetyltransferase-like isoleucine patch superfamily enzyme